MNRITATAVYDGQDGWTESDEDYRDVRDNLNHILYMDGEYLEVRNKTDTEITLFNSNNDKDFAVFKISTEQYDRDFVETEENW